MDEKPKAHSFKCPNPQCLVEFDRRTEQETCRCKFCGAEAIRIEKAKAIGLSVQGKGFFVG